MKLTFDIHELVPYINWAYYYFAWQVKDPTEQVKLKADALQRLETLEGRYQAYALFQLLPANSDGDDILIQLNDGHDTQRTDEKHADDRHADERHADERHADDRHADDRKHTANLFRLPMLRQQTALPSRSLADYIRPLESGKTDTIGIFATSVSIGLETDFAQDDFLRMQSQLLADRLAEAAAEKMHLDVRTKYWGYAPHEHLTMDELHAEKFQGIRPAVGYPSMPDTSINFLIDTILDMKQIGIRLTESGAMKPHASVSGLMMAHQEASYFPIGKIGEDQLHDYAHRRAIPVEMMRKFLSANMK